MTPLVIQYPLDPTGTNPNNLVQGEAQTLIANRTYRAIAPNNGAFFMTSMQVFDVATGLQLTDGTNGTVEQYYCCEYYELPSERYGQEIDAIVIIKDPTVSNNVTINYQALGGPYSTSATALIQQLEALGLDNRPVAWGDIIGKPSTYPPSFHLHDIGDVYGFEYVVHALDRIRDAIEIGDQASYDLLYAYVDAAIAGVNTGIAAIETQLTNHINNFNNPHQTTAAQLNVYTISQVNAITTPISTSLTAHIDNENNPHDTTAAQVGAWTVAQTQAAIAAAVAGVAIGYTPVQQGGGANQGTNKIYLGYDGSGLRLQVDSTDFGDLALQSWVSPQLATLTAGVAAAATVTQLNTNTNELQTQITNNATTAANNLAANTNELQAQITANKLAYTPVQQGGGANQANNKIYLGWDGSSLRLQVDSTDLGDLALQSWASPQFATLTAGVAAAATTATLNADVASLQSQINACATTATLNADVASLTASINGKQASGNYAVLGTSVSFSGVVSTGDLIVGGTMYSANDIWAFQSDERLKLLTPLKGALEKLRQVSGYTYRYTPDALQYLGVEDREYLGYSAQEIQSVAPQIVGLAPFDRDPDTGLSKSGENFLTVQYEKFGPLLLEGIKELDAKLTALIDHLGVKDAIDNQLNGG